MINTQQYRDQLAAARKLIVEGGAALKPRQFEQVEAALDAAIALADDLPHTGDPAESVVVDLLYSGTATDQAWQDWETSNGELNLMDRHGTVVATLAVNQWAHVYAPGSTPVITTPPNPFAAPPAKPGDAF